jgi:hypothetical protein
MQALALLRHRRFSQTINQTLFIPSLFVYQTPYTCYNFLNTHTIDKFPKKSLDPEGPKCLSSRIEKLPRGESVGYAFQSWMGEGFPIHRGDVFHTINRLRKLRLNKRALEVCLLVLSL